MAGDGGPARLAAGQPGAAAPSDVGGPVCRAGDRRGQMRGAAAARRVGLLALWGRGNRRPVPGTGHRAGDDAGRRAGRSAAGGTVHCRAGQARPAGGVAARGRAGEYRSRPGVVPASGGDGAGRGSDRRAGGRSGDVSPALPGRWSAPGGDRVLSLAPAGRRPGAGGCAGGGPGRAWAGRSRGACRQPEGPGSGRFLGEPAARLAPGRGPECHGVLGAGRHGRIAAGCRRGSGAATGAGGRRHRGLARRVPRPVANRSGDAGGVAGTGRQAADDGHFVQVRRGVRAGAGIRPQCQPAGPGGDRASRRSGRRVGTAWRDGGGRAPGGDGAVGLSGRGRADRPCRRAGQLCQPFRHAVPAERRRLCDRGRAAGPCRAGGDVVRYAAGAGAAFGGVPSPVRRLAGDNAGPRDRGLGRGGGRSCPVRRPVHVAALPAGVGAAGGAAGPRQPAGSQGELPRRRVAAAPRLHRVLSVAARGGDNPRAGTPGHARHRGMAAGQGGSAVGGLLSQRPDRRPAGDLSVHRQQPRRGRRRQAAPGRGDDRASDPAADPGRAARDRA